MLAQTKLLPLEIFPRKQQSSGEPLKVHVIAKTRRILQCIKTTTSKENLFIFYRSHKPAMQFIKK